MTPSELKFKYQQNNPDGHFFDRATMRFFGDTMKNYGIRDAGTHWALYRKRPVKHGLKSIHYFDKRTFCDTTSTPQIWATDTHPTKQRRLSHEGSNHKD